MLNAGRMFCAALHTIGLGLALLGAAAGVARASERDPIPFEDQQPEVEPPLAYAGPDAAFVMTTAFHDLSDPLRVANAAWAGGVLVVALAESLRGPADARAGVLELRPLVAPGPAASVGVGLFGRF